MVLVLQIWGGLFYLLNKIFLACAEHTEKNENTGRSLWRIWAWSIYLLGVPPWVIILARERKWIAAGLEAGGVPAMILGLIIAIKGSGREPKWLKYVIVTFIIIGIGYSIYDWRGIMKLAQWYELVMITGFLIGTYQIARLKVSGYLWFILMHLACIGMLNEIGKQGYQWLAATQGLSILFVWYSYFTKKAKING